MLSTVANLNQEGYDVAIDILGEHVNTEKELLKLQIDTQNCTMRYLPEH